MPTKPELLVFLGAGASVGLGIPSTGALTRDVLAATRTPSGWQNTAVLPGQLPPVDELLQVLNAAYGQANFEHLLHALEALSSLRRSWRPSTAPAHRVVEAALTGGPRPSLIGAFDDLWQVAARNALYRTIHTSVATADQGIGAHADWGLVSGFLQLLEKEFEVYVVTTNYDTIVEQALNWGAQHQGFNQMLPPVEPALRFVGQRNPQRLMHLHGSLLFGYRSGSVDPNRFVYEDEFEDLYLYPNATSAVATWFGRSTSSSQSGRDTTVGPLITGMQKTDKLLAEPYLSYFKHFGTLAERIPRLLLVGYGFGDAHVNEIVSRMTKWHGPDRRIAVVDYCRQQDWSPSSAWTSERLRMYRAVARWAEQQDAMDALSWPDPWVPDPTAAGSGRVEVYFRGFCDTLRHHASRITRFLR